ncbi:MAG TPA: hypothetical protein EYQ42_10755 [Thiotrichaceae bacterium]|jgi:hypothetical protein|nr:hypothetical protein [Thiotrichaceae bacterium]HIM08907.1 hypothetical protein [Gammaproteobacteria bacterium]
MSYLEDDCGLITNLNINEYFNDAIHDAISHQRVGLNDETVVYIVNLLTYYALSENIFENDIEGTSSKPLAFIYKDAVEAQSLEERNTHLRRLGDVALFTSGFFSGSLERTAVGVDYFISMGGNAYSSLADRAPRTIPDKSLNEVFTDLAEHFISYVDVLTEVSESSELNDDRDVLSLYESWLSTGSDYARQRLQEQGVLTFPSSHNEH